MDSGLKFHVSIQKGFSIPSLQRCRDSDCCYPSKVHCPFCSPDIFKPTKSSTRTRLHMNNHLRRAVYVGDYTIYRCRLQCRNQPHYHCLYCAATLIRRIDFTNHVRGCQSQRAPHLSQLPVRTEAPMAPSLCPGQSDAPTYDIESDEDSKGISIILDSDEQDSEGESSSHSVIPVIPESNECDSVEPDFSKCDRTVQTDREKPQDCDEYYFMSLVKVFKKLSPHKKAEVRIKIERLLFEAEFK